MEPIDRLDALLRRFAVQAQQFYDGNLCHTRQFPAEAGRGFLHILRAGQMTVRDGAAREGKLVTEPMILLYPRPHEHAFMPVAAEGVELACATLDFHGGNSHPLVAALPEVLTVPISEVGGLEATLDLLASEIDAISCGHRHIVDRLFEVVLLKLLRHLLDRPGQYGVPAGMFGGLADPHIAAALAAMHEAPGSAWTLETLAKTAHMSRSAFAARFHELVGATPHDYLTSWRLTVGKQMLRDQLPVSQIAAELGYSGSSFSRVFAQREGVSPRAWVNRVREPLAG
ncbi:AraC family transcriptional regulator [Leucobacter albus]|uniref:AraC family transcriptional regulator n=1 Tax=Leucobacter albus TaxID=272210 RepID=A0ABW3TRP8_9MICO